MIFPRALIESVLSISFLDWNNSELINGDVPEGIKRIKEQDGPEIQIHGSGNLIQTLLKHDLVDEFWLYSLSHLVSASVSLQRVRFQLDSNFLKARLHQVELSLSHMSAQVKSRQGRLGLRLPARQSLLAENGSRKRDKIGKRLQLTIRVKISYSRHSMYNSLCQMRLRWIRFYIRSLRK